MIYQMIYHMIYYMIYHIWYDISCCIRISSMFEKSFEFINREANKCHVLYMIFDISNDISCGNLYDMSYIV